MIICLGKSPRGPATSLESWRFRTRVVLKDPNRKAISSRAFLALLVEPSKVESDRLRLQIEGAVSSTLVGDSDLSARAAGDELPSTPSRGCRSPGLRCRHRPVYDSLGFSEAN